MSRAEAPTIHCDADEEGCTEWALDEYAMYTDRINGIKITSTHRAVGWLTVDERDLCPDHAADGGAS